MNHAPDPLLVIVSGAPGSGKTTLARRLAAALRLPIISKDDVKEPLMDALGASDRAASQHLGTAAYAVLFAVAERLLASGPGLVLESNFARGRSEPSLESLRGRARAIAIHCAPPATIARDRYARRAASRHSGHHDEVALLDGAWDLRADAIPPQLDVPLLTVDTSEGYDPPFEAIVSFCRSGHPASGRSGTL